MIATKLLFVLALSAQASRVLERSAAFRAKMWLKAHDEPSADEAGMNDLKNSDPNAFAIVQALLTKKSLGLLDPSHPSAAFTGSAPRQHKSFQEEADEAGLTQDSPSPAVSEMEMRSSMPYPSASTPSQPYPEVHASHDPWNYHTTHSDDDLIASVVGNDPAPAAQPLSDNTLSLSAATQQMQQSMPAPVEHVAPAAPAPLMNGMPSLSWGNPMAGSDSEAPVAAAAQPVQEESSSEPALSLSAVRNQEMGRMGITDSAPVAPAAPAVYAQPASPLENEENQMGIPSMNWQRPGVPESPVSRPSLASLVRVTSDQPKPAPVVTNSYMANSDLTSSAAGMDTQTAAQQRLSMSSFHSSMSSYRSGYRMNLHANDATPSSDSILAIRKQNMGNSYDSFLKQARTNRWKRAMDVTMNMKSSLPGGVSNQYLSDLS